MKRFSGFTLVEVIMSIVILGIIAGALAPVINQNMKAYIDTRSRAQILDKIRLSLGRLEREIRQSAIHHTSVSGGVLTFTTTTVGGNYISRNDNTPKIANSDCSRKKNQVPSELERFLPNEPIATLCILYPGDLSALSTQQRESLIIGSDLTKVDSVAVHTSDASACPSATDDYDCALWKVNFDSETTFSSASASTNNVLSFTDYRHRISLSGSQLIWERADASDTVFAATDQGILLNDVTTFMPTYDIASGTVTIALAVTDGNESISFSEQVYVRN